MTHPELSDSQKALRVLAGAMAVGLLSVVIYSAHAGGQSHFAAFLSVGILLAGASAFCGGALGFLFGIPRTLQQDKPSANTVDPSQESREPQIDYRVNTNLEQISDWLTKILVGVGLTQIASIRDGMTAVASAAGSGLGTHGQVFAMALMTYSVVLGFLFGYLWTRLFLAGALRVADQAAIGSLKAEVQKATEKVESTERHLAEMKKQHALDAEALNLAYRQLNPSPDLPKVSQQELDQAIKDASRPIRVQIFNQAWQVRADNWRNVKDKPKMERTIPLFRALISGDTENRFHMNHGQLGFALKDQRVPDWQAAEQSLSTAISVRGSWQDHGWLFYELNRALCRIQLDEKFQQDLPSEEAYKNPVIIDLGAANHAPDLAKIIREDAVIKKWMTINKVKFSDLRKVK